jgi:hypothetical protein
VSLRRIRARPSCTVARGPCAQCMRGLCSWRWRGPCAQGVRGPRLRGAWPSSASAGAARGGGVMLSYCGDLTGARETAGKAWWGSPARGRRRGTTRCRRWRRDAVSVDVGVGDFGHGGDGSDRAMAASDSGGRDGEAKRHVQAAAWVGAFGQRRGTARQAMRSGSGCLNGAVGTAFKPPGAFGHRRPRQPIGRGAARHCR